jgi:hypothetical protein
MFFPKKVCILKCQKKVENFKFIKIDVRNPMKNLKFKQIMIQRKNVHKIFDKIKCDKFMGILDEINEKYGQSFDHLVMREHVFHFSEIYNFELLEKKIRIL